MRIVLAIALLSTGCGLIADALSDAASVDVDTAVLPEATIGDTYLEDLTVSVEADQASPTWSLPEFLDTKDWGPLLAADVAFAEVDGPQVFDWEVEAASWSVTGDGVFYVTVDVYSRDGWVVGADGNNDAPFTPDLCMFAIDPTTTTAADFSASMRGCLRQWVQQNGTPMQLAFDIVLDGTANDASVFRMTNTSYMRALKNVEADTYTRYLSIDGQVVDNAEIIDITEMSISSSARWVRLPPNPDLPRCREQAGPLFLYGWGSVIHTGSPTRNTHGMVLSAMNDGRDYNYAVNNEGKVTSDYGIVRWNPAQPGWMRATLQIGIDMKKAALAAPEGSPAPAAPVRGGYIVAGHCPREGVVNFKLQGLAKFNTEKAQ